MRPTETIEMGLNSNEPPFGSNAIRLGPREWSVAAAIIIAILVVLPVVWRLFERFEPNDDYRVPFRLSNDYWVYNRLAAWTAEQNRILVIGDSVVWGEYVQPDQTLTHYLNEQAAAQRFVNGGVSGSHPLALEGLVRYYATDIAGKRVILHLNLLWLSSPERDLSAKSDREIAFNHPQLIPQFGPSVPAYKATTSDRLGVEVDRRLPVRRLTNHLRVAWYNSLDVHTWSIEHPYETPTSAVSVQLPAPSYETRHGGKQLSWRQRGIEKQKMEWVALADSLQWQAFLRTVELLQLRGNIVFVVIGPFNTHMLTEKSQQKYVRLKEEAIERLRILDIAFCDSPVLPSAEFADASHPLDVGYARMAAAIHKFIGDWQKR